MLSSHISTFGCRNSAKVTNRSAPGSPYLASKLENSCLVPEHIKSSDYDRSRSTSGLKTRHFRLATVTGKYYEAYFFLKHPKSYPKSVRFTQPQMVVG